MSENWIRQISSCSDSSLGVKKKFSLNRFKVFSIGYSDKSSVLAIKSFKESYKKTKVVKS